MNMHTSFMFLKYCVKQVLLLEGTEEQQDHIPLSQSLVIYLELQCWYCSEGVGSLQWGKFRLKGHIICNYVGLILSSSQRRK